MIDSASKSITDNVDIYNITNNVPLPEGYYYTTTTAIAAVPTDIRKLGFIITY